MDADNPFANNPAVPLTTTVNTLTWKIESPIIVSSFPSPVRPFWLG